jgi:hypothetical protein
MIAKANKNKNKNIALTTALILLIIISLVPASGFFQADLKTNTLLAVDQSLKQSSPSFSIVGINETNSLNAINSYYTFSSMPPNIDSVSMDATSSTLYSRPDMSGFFFIPPNINSRGQMDGSDRINNFYEPPTAIPILLDASKFVTYTYGGYPVQQLESNKFVFSFPDTTDQGQIAGSDALAWNFYAIQKMDFDAAFIAPKINALGFDEMAIFASSNTSTYKGTEFGVRMDLYDGFIYGYIQEPNGNNGDVNFRMIELMPNDGITHHYTIIVLGSEVSFYIDGLENGYLSFSSNNDYSSLSFSICAVVHRFTDGWDSFGDNMIIGNFSLNQQ